MRQRRLAAAYIYTKISTSFMFGVWGIFSLMVGMKAMKARVSVAIPAILPERVLSWKKMKRLMTPKIQRGTKIEIRLTPGYLYMGILKWTYWKFFILESESSPSFLWTSFGSGEFS